MQMSTENALQMTMAQDVIEIVTGDHAELEHLDFASSGHTGFQATIGDLSDIRSGAALGATAVQPSAISDMATKTWTQEQGYGTYSKPSGGIPSSDMASAVQTSLGKADTALQEHQSLAGYATQTWVEGKGYLTEHQSLSAYRTSAAQDVIDEGKQDVLTAGENITIVDNVISASGGGEEEIFVCEYNVTTYAEVEAAYNAGKQLVCVADSLEEALSGYTFIANDVSVIEYEGETYFMFMCTSYFTADGEFPIHMMFMLSQTEWMYLIYPVQTRFPSREISSESTDEQYPSAKLLYDQLLLKQDTLTAGSNVSISDGVISATDTTYSDATTSASGLMSASDKTKLNGIESGAEVNVNADWNAASGDAQILNKPTIPTVSVSDTGTATDVVSYITINGTEKKIAGGGGGGIPTFEINQSGHLIVSASTQTEANKFSVNSQGHLIYTN